MNLKVQVRFGGGAMVPQEIGITCPTLLNRTPTEAGAAAAGACLLSGEGVVYGRVREWSCGGGGEGGRGEGAGEERRRVAGGAGRAAAGAGGGIGARRPNQELSAPRSACTGDATGPFFVEAVAGIAYSGGNNRRPTKANHAKTWDAK